MSTFQAKDSLIFGRQLEAQEVHVNADLTTGVSDLPSAVVIDNSTLTATVITLDLAEPVSKAFRVTVTNRATGANVALAAVPSLAVANKISVTVNGTGITSCDIHAVYKVQE
jgi:hypothetical protein